MNILDNAVGKNTLVKVNNIIYNNNFPWYYGATAFAESNNQYSFSHVAITDGKSISALGDMLATILYTLCDTTNQDIDRILRIRIGKIMATPEPIKHEPHVDLLFPHKTALLYLHDSDGDTDFYDLNFNYKTRLTPNEYFLKNQSKAVLEESITPKYNRFVWFDGCKYHSSTSPTTIDRRIVINFNYITK
jgi:hypothetical protein